jgi:hypothetical protein
MEQFLTSALDGGGGACQPHAPPPLTSGRGACARCTEGWVGPWTGLDGCGKSPPPHPTPPGWDVGTVKRSTVVIRLTVNLGHTEVSGHFHNPAAHYRRRSFGNHRIGSCEGPRDVLNIKKCSFCHAENRAADPPAHSLVTIHTSVLEIL